MLKNFESWKEFKLDKLFEVSGVGSIGIEDIQLKYGEGDYPYITRTEKNNGIAGFYNYAVAPENVLTIETTLSGLCFYHPYKFSTGDHIAILVPTKNYKIKEYFDEDIALFIRTIWRKNSYKYDYGRPATTKNIENTFLLLPIDKLGNPDWVGMKQYIQSLRPKVTFKKIKTNISQELKLHCEWGEFSFVDKKLWGNKIIHGKRLIETDRVNGETPYYSASEYNNGRTDSIGNPLFTICNCIIYTTFGDAFWAEGEFTCSDEIYAFHNLNLNKYNALFIITIMKQNKYKFQFGRKAFYNKFKSETIRLPIDKKGNPDWIYMERYIKSLPYADLI